MDDEAQAEEMIGKIDPYEPTPEIWKALQNFINTNTKKYETEYLHLHTKLVRSNEIPFAKEVVIITLFMRLQRDVGAPFVEHAFLALDDNHKAFAFYETKEE